MGPPVTMKVNFRGNVKTFVVSDLNNADWESMEMWIKTSFGICHFQAKYFDEDNEEISINSQDEYQEGVKSAVKQGNQLHMNVYKTKGLAGSGPVKPEVKEMKVEVRPVPPYPSMVKTVDRGTQVTREKDSVVVKDVKVNQQEDEAAPAWFRTYMEKFKDEVVKEVVEKMCSDFSGQCCTHLAPCVTSGEAGEASAPEPKVISSSPGTASSTPQCSMCRRPASDGGYQCSVCVSCVLCELGRHGHDPSHHLGRTRTPLSVAEYGMMGESRFPRRGDGTVRKAERQRLRAERKQLKAEVKEIKKKLKLERRGLLWSSAPAPSPAPEPQASCPEAPEVSHPTLVPTMAALFLDENLPDGTRLEPGTKFIKYWKMRNSGTISWTSGTKLKFMWGNLVLASEEKTEVAVPLLQPGQVGVVSVAFVAPVLEGTYTSHWRLVHCGEQFGPRVWCSIVVDLSTSLSKRLKTEHNPPQEERCDVDSGDTGCVDQREDYIPSVELLTAQDLLSFELLDINIVQELEKVPNNTPADMTPCISPLPHDGPLLEKPGSALNRDDAKMDGIKSILVRSQDEKGHGDPPTHEEGDEEISGTQFVCETVIRSLALEEAPDHKPLRRPQLSPRKPEAAYLESGVENLYMAPCALKLEEGPERDDDVRDWDEVSSQTSSASSEDYIVVLPECFDTSRPLGESMYSSALSQTGTVGPGEPSDEPREPKGGRTAPPPSIHSSVNQLLCASQTLEDVPLTPEVVLPPAALLPPSISYQHRSEIPYVMEPRTIETLQPEIHSEGSAGSTGLTSTSQSSRSQPGSSTHLRPHEGLTDGLVKGALSVAASAYKALFTGPSCSTQRAEDTGGQDASMMAVLLEMGFSDELLNQRLLRKYHHNLLDVVNELVQMADNEWYATRY